MPSADRCFCKRVYAPKFIGEKCPGLTPEEDEPADYSWFTDDEVNQLITRANWNTKILDGLLERSVYCRKWNLFLFFIYPLSFRVSWPDGINDF